MTIAAISPPEDLPTGPGVLLALVVPFGEAIERPHPDAGHRFSRDSVNRPAPDKVYVNVDHDRDRVVGIVVGATKSTDGLWCSLKLGNQGMRLVRAGRSGLSPEIADDGELIGVALCVGALGGLPSARLYDALPSLPGTEAPEERASVPSFPLPRPIGEGRFKAEVAEHYSSGPAWGLVEGSSGTLMGSGAKAHLNPEPKPPPSPFVGAPVLSQVDPELEVARARARFEEERTGRKEWEEWPEQYRRKLQEDYRALVEQQEALRAFEAAERARRQAEQARTVSEVEPPKRRRWRWRS